MLRNMETNNIKYSETNMITKSDLIDLISKEYDEVPENFRTYYSPVKTDTLNSLINENLGGFMDVFSIIEKNLNIIDKVQLGLTCKDMHEIMKPIIKKDDVHVVRCGCKKNYHGCMNAERCRRNPEIFNIIENEREFCKKNKVKNIVSFGCIHPLCIYEHLENIVCVGNDFSSYLGNFNSVTIKKDCEEIQMIYSYYNYSFMEYGKGKLFSFSEKEYNEIQEKNSLIDIKRNPDIKLHYHKMCWICNKQSFISECSIKKRTIAKKKLIDFYKDEYNQDFFTSPNRINLELNNKPDYIERYCDCEFASFITFRRNPTLQSN